MILKLQNVSADLCTLACHRKQIAQASYSERIRLALVPSHEVELSQRSA